MKAPAWFRTPKLRLPRWPKRQRRERPAGLSVPRSGDRLVRWCTVLAVVAVAGVAAYVSYWHAVEVVTHHGERGIIGHLYPITIDGIIVAASMVVLDAARHLEAAPRLAWCLLAAGILVTLAANVTYGVRFGLAGALWAAWPAVAFVGCYELLMMLVRASARRAETADIGHGFVAVPSTAEQAAEACLRATIAAGNPLSINQLTERFSLPRKAATELRTRVLAEANGHGPGNAEADATERNTQ